MAERIEISAARGRLKELTDRAAMGEEIILTRYNRDVARLMPTAPSEVVVRRLQPVGVAEGAGE